MNAAQFLELIAKNVARVKRYVNGGDGTNGECDCIGLIIGALRLGGTEWPWTHGSNYTARYRMRWLSPLANANSLRPGQLVFKAHEPGADGWKLPTTYNGHPDQRDYYHVGVVASTNPLDIVHCTGVEGGIKHDSKVGAWNWHGEIDLVTYEGGAAMEPYMVIGGRLNLRNGPGYQYQLMTQIPDGTVIGAAEDPKTPGWMRAEYDGISGYVMAQFLEKVDVQDAPAESGEPVTLVLEREMAEALLSMLTDALK